MAAETMANCEHIEPEPAEFGIILSTNYGLHYKLIKPLIGYSCLNYHVVVEDYLRTSSFYIPRVCKDGYIMKIMNYSDLKEAEFFEAQTEFLLHLDRNNICCPKPTKNVNGEYFTYYNFSHGKCIVRLLEYVSGTMLKEVSWSSKLCYQIGQFAAKMDVALETFKHPVYNTHKSIWMLKSVPKLKFFLHASMLDEEKKAFASKVIEEFTSKVLSIEDRLEKGIIHGDINEQNILVEKIGRTEWSVKAFIGFGDSQRSCYLFELAIAITHMIFYAKTIDAGAFVLAGYSSIKKLPEEELNLLRICICARFIQSLLLGCYTLQLNPTNKYIIRRTVADWPVLEEIWHYPDVSFLTRWKLVLATTKY